MKVSAIIPTYNRDCFLEGAVNSVLDQTQKVAELLIVDDGSDDTTFNLVHSIMKKSEIPVRYIYQNRKGPSAARNLGIHHAEYELVAFLDSDDRWQKSKIKKQVTMMEKFPEYKISHTDEKWLRRGKHLNKKKIHKVHEGDIFEHCLAICAVGMSTVMIRKSIFEKYGVFDENMLCCEDYDFWLRISWGEHFLLVDEPLTVKHGGREDQVSYIHRVGMDKLRIGSIERLLPVLEKHGEKEKLIKAMQECSKKCAIYGKGCLKHKKKNEGESFIRKHEKYSELLKKFK